MGVSIAERRARVKEKIEFESEKMSLTRQNDDSRLSHGKGVDRIICLDDDLSTPCSAMDESLSSSLLSVKYLKSLGNYARKGLGKGLSSRAHNCPLGNEVHHG
jgi:hypothetical protein